MFDIIVFVLFIVITLGVGASLFLNNANGLAYLQLLISFVGVLISFKEVRPNFLGRLVINVRTLRISSIILLIVVIALQAAILFSPIRPICCVPSTPTPSGPPTKFVFTTITLKTGNVLQNQEPVPIPVAQLPLTITGTYSSPGSGQVWVVVEDLAGYYYLQSLPVRFADGGMVGKWRASNVNTNVGTNRIDFVYVTPQGNDTFQHLVDTQQFGAFPQLPDGSQILQTIKIQVSPTAFDFEDGTQGWNPSDTTTQLSLTTSPVHSGNRALEVKIQLPAPTNIEVAAYFNQVKPAGFSSLGPYDFSGKRVSCFVYLPRQLAGGVLLQNFVKDKNSVVDHKSGTEYGPPHNIALSDTEKWIEIAYPVGTGTPDPQGFDITQVDAMGMSIKTNEGSSLTFKGSFYVDDCTITQM